MKTAFREMKKVMAEPLGIRIAPSILAADFSRLGDEIATVQQGGADLLHLDVMDAHFVPNLTFGPLIVKAIDKLTSLRLSTHLMMTDPEPYFEAFVKAGSDDVIVHIESYPDPRRALSRIGELGARPGLTLNPATPFASIEPYLADVDVLLVMSVYPGFGGQAFMPEVLPKVTRARQLKQLHRYRYEIHIDGGIDLETGPRAVRAGAEVLVAGSAIFRAPDPGTRVEEMRRTAGPH
jgi:ribulose-phosphate 3-epimerase